MDSRRTRSSTRRLLYVLGSSLLLLAATLIGIFLLRDADMQRDQNNRQADTINGIVTRDDLLVSVNAVEPAFAGAYVDESGVLQIWLTNPSTEGAERAQAELVRINSVQYSTRDYIIHRAQYSFAQLYRWKEDLGTLHLLISELTSVAISIPDNYIELGIADAQKRLVELHAELKRRNIPQNAVHVEEESPVSGFDSPS